MSDEAIVALLEELLAWTRFANREALVRTWEKVLTDEKHLKAYELTDGTRSQKEVGDLCGLSQPTVSTLWQRWRRLGLTRDVGGKVRHIARPSDLGVPMPNNNSIKSAPAPAVGEPVKE